MASNSLCPSAIAPTFILCPVRLSPPMSKHPINNGQRGVKRMELLGEIHPCVNFPTQKNTTEKHEKQYNYRTKYFRKLQSYSH